MSIDWTLNKIYRRRESIIILILWKEWTIRFYCLFDFEKKIVFFFFPGEFPSEISHAKSRHVCLIAYEIAKRRTRKNLS